MDNEIPLEKPCINSIKDGKDLRNDFSVQYTQKWNKDNNESGMMYCMDCADYQIGGMCKKTGKAVSALKEMCGTGEKPVVEMAVKSDEKFCRKCGRILPMEMFHNSRRAPDGKQVYCKECSRKAYKAWHDRNIKAV